MRTATTCGSADEREIDSSAAALPGRVNVSCFWLTQQSWPLRRFADLDLHIGSYNAVRSVDKDVNVR
jgi:hypothetical protein